MKALARNAAVFAAVLGVCMALLFAVCALIPQSGIERGMQQADAYFAARGGRTQVVPGMESTYADHYADIALFDVIWYVDAQRPLYSMLCAPYYRNEGGSIRDDFHAAVALGQQPNAEYARYWHGSQVLLRPLLTVCSVVGCRAVLFGMLLALNGYLAWLLWRMRAVKPLWIYALGMVLVQFWMCLFTLEYVMSFLVMTGACIAVARLWRSPCDERVRQRRMTDVCIAAGVCVCFMDFLTTETLTLTVPVLLYFMLVKHHDPQKLGWKHTLRLLVRFGAAWLCAYAMTFAVKWALVYLLMGKEALMNVFASAAYRIDGAAEQMQGAVLPMMFARNIGILIPFSSDFTISTALWLGALVVFMVFAAWYLLRGDNSDWVLNVVFVLMGALPYVRMLALSSHALDHFFFTYRAQMATVMALAGVLAYSIGKKAPKRRRR